LLVKPLISYTIQQALRWGKATKVIVSTDSPEIAKVAQKFGAEIPFMRPQELASDTAGKVGVIKHALIECEKMYKEKYDIVVDLDATSPIRTPDDLDQCLKLFLKSKPSTLFSVVHPHKNPYFNMVEKDKTGKIVLCKTLKKKVVRRQDAPAVYSMNASIYFYNRDYLLSADHPSPLSDDIEIYLMGENSSIDIDRELDFKFIEFLVKEGHVKL